MRTLRGRMTGGVLALLVALSLFVARPSSADRQPEQVAAIGLSWLYADDPYDPGRRKPGPRIRHVNGITIIDTRTVGAPSPAYGWCLRAAGKIVTPCY